LAGADVSLIVDSFAYELATEESQTRASLELLMALRETALKLQDVDLEAKREQVVDLPLWATVALFRSVLKRLR